MPIWLTTRRPSPSAGPAARRATPAHRPKLAGLIGSGDSGEDIARNRIVTSGCQAYVPSAYQA